MRYDFLRYAPANLKIQTQEGKLVPFQFNEIQLILDDIAKNLEHLTGMVRMVILKARREGVTTYWTGKFFHNTIHKRNRYSYIITHEPDATDFVFKMVKRYYDNCTLKPQTKYNNTTLLEFNNSTGTGLDSAFRVATANKADIGSAQLIHNLLLSELAKYPAQTVDETLTSVLQCVPDDPDTRVIIESTAKGHGGEFHKRFWGARHIYEVYLDRAGRAAWRHSLNYDADPNNHYARVFIPCFVFDKYRKEPEFGFEPTTADHAIYGNEQALKDRYGVGDMFLAWRRDVIVNKCRGSLSIFHQEYPMNPKEAFLASGRPVFNMAICDERSTLAVSPNPLIYYDYNLSSGQFFTKTPYLGDTDSLLCVYKEPDPHCTYVISADVSEGIEIDNDKYDWSCFDVLDRVTGEQVATWHGKIEPTPFGTLLEWVARRYNWAWIVPERNNHGHAVLGKLYERKYPNIWVEEVNEAPNTKRMRYGWKTDKVSKGMIIDELIETQNNYPDLIKSRDTWMEMMSFKHRPDGTMSAEPGSHDDRVMSFAIGNYCRHRLGPPMIPIEYQSAPAAAASATPSPLAWG